MAGSRRHVSWCFECFHVSKCSSFEELYYLSVSFNDGICRGCQLAALPYKVFGLFLGIWTLEDITLLVLRLRRQAWQAECREGPNYEQLGEADSVDELSVEPEMSLVVGDELVSEENLKDDKDKV